MIKLLRLLLRQSCMDFRKRNLGTLLGMMWPLISPMINIGIIYFVFSYGLKAGVMGNISFINWFVPGMLAWLFIVESIGSGCYAIVENSHLVTKIVFPIQILPPSKVIATLPVHMILMIIFVLLMLVQNCGTVHTWWQLGYYLACAIIFCTAISFITSSCMVFVRDIGNVVGVLIQVLFWATPIFWDPVMISNSHFRFLLLSPFNYIIQGYRDSLFNGLYFWDKPLETFVFWFTILIISFFSYCLFVRTRHHFADVL